jgi:hypothetical protein
MFSKAKEILTVSTRSIKPLAVIGGSAVEFFDTEAGRRHRKDEHEIPFSPIGLALGILIARNRL